VLLKCADPLLAAALLLSTVGELVDAAPLLLELFFFFPVGALLLRWCGLSSAVCG